MELQFESTPATLGINEEEQRYDLASGPGNVRVVHLNDTYDIQEEPSREDEYEETGDPSTKNLIDDLRRGEALRAVMSKGRVQSTQ